MRRVSKAVSYKEKAYEILKTSIITHKLKPGEQMNERVLAEKLGISRTPVREALQMLENEGWLKTEPWKGTFVSDITVQDIKEVFQLRIALEPMVVELAAENMENKEIEKLEQLLHKQKLFFEQKNAPDFLKTDMDFHMCLAQATGNQRLINILNNLNDMIIRLGMYAIQTYNRYIQTLKEHQRIIDALKIRDAVAAKDAMIYHVLTTEEKWKTLEIKPDSKDSLNQVSNP